MPPTGLNKIPDAGDLRQLESGLVIVRRMKHEWRTDLGHMTPERLRIHTGKVKGSKFLAAWSLDLLVEWIADQIDAAGWQRQDSSFLPLDISVDEPVGLVEGRKVYTIRIVGDGRHVHAYPIEDKP